MVKNYCLSRCHGPLGPVKVYPHGSAFQRRNSGGLVLLTITGLNSHLNGIGKRVKGDPIYISGNQAGGIKGAFRANGNRIPFHALFDYIEALVRGQTQPPALSNRITHRSFMPAYDMFVHIQEVTGWI